MENSDENPPKLRNCRVRRDGARGFRTAWGAASLRSADEEGGTRTGDDGKDAEHAKLQKHFLALAAKYGADAADHAELGQDYLTPQTGRLMPGSPKLRAQHCDRLSASLTAAAKDARELAAEHGKIATAK